MTKCKILSYTSLPTPSCPSVNHKSNKRTKSFSSKVYFIVELIIYKDMNTSFEGKHKVIRSGCVLKAAAQVCVPGLAVSSSQYFNNLRAGRAADDKLVKIFCYFIMSHIVQCHPVLSKYESPSHKCDHFRQYLSLQYESPCSVNS